jgi:hypothetical protein
MNEIITIKFFAVTPDRWGVNYISWSEIDRVLKGDVKQKFITSLIGKKRNKIGVFPGVLERFLIDYYHIKD